MNGRRRGMTLVELLIAGSILTVLLGALGSLFASSRRAYDANAGATAGAGQVQSAIQALQYDASLAGYCGVTEACDAVADALEVVVGSGNGPCRPVAELAVRYVEDRFTAGGPTTQVVTYALDDQARLVRAVGSGDAVPIAANIEAFEFCGYRARSDADGALRFSRPSTGDLLGIEFRLIYGRAAVSSATERFAVALPNVP